MGYANRGHVVISKLKRRGEIYNNLNLSGKASNEEALMLDRLSDVLSFSILWKIVAYAYFWMLKCRNIDHALNLCMFLDVSFKFLNIYSIYCIYYIIEKNKNVSPRVISYILERKKKK